MIKINRVHFKLSQTLHNLLKGHDFHNRMSTTCGSLVDCRLPETLFDAVKGWTRPAFSDSETVRLLTADCVSLVCGYENIAFQARHAECEYAVTVTMILFINNRLTVRFKRLFAFSFGTKREFAMTKYDNLKCSPYGLTFEVFLTPNIRYWDLFSGFC
jgi:hypothetical protein